MPSLDHSLVCLDLGSSRNFSFLEIHIPTSWQVVPEFSTSHSDYSIAFEMEGLQLTIIRLRGPQRIVWVEMKPSYVDVDDTKLFVNPQSKREQKVVKEIGMLAAGPAVEYIPDFGFELNGS